MNFRKIRLVLLLLVIASGIFAQPLTRDMTKEHQIENQLAALNPALLETFQAATLALDRDELERADSLYTEVRNKVPDFDVVNRRLGIIRYQQGNIRQGFWLCRHAVELNRSEYNLYSLATVYADPANLSAATRNLDSAAMLLEEGYALSDGTDYSFQSFLAQIALQQDNLVAFRAAVAKLTNKHPEVMITHYYAAILATADEDWKKAKDEILTAQKMGLEETSVKAFLDSGVQRNLTIQQLPMYFVWLILIWIGGLLVLYLTGKLLSNITMRSVELPHHTGESTGSERMLRSIYRLLINTGGIYYYVSLPIILVLTIALVAGLFYAFWMLGRIPVQIMLLLTIGAGFSIYGMIRSLLVRINYTDPGRVLSPEEAPGLYALVKEVADTMGTRPIDEIRITPTTDLAVYENGTRKEKYRDQAKRVLILGAGILTGFGQHEFKAVLAHEYGHFNHRDTAGGEVALRVRGDMHKYFMALYLAGQNVWWNIAFQFLRLYNFIFLRISHGATRLQEVLADRVAARTYGVKAFQDGLTHVIKREIEFTRNANAEIEEAENLRRPLNNLYELTGNMAEVEEELKKALTQKTSEDDTHPAPLDRFRYVSTLNAGTFPEDHTTVPDLFENWEKLEHEMTTTIEQQVQRNK